MSTTTIPSVDFRFRKGTKSAMSSAAEKNGTINFTKDTRELYVDLDGSRIKISDVCFEYTEAEIQALSAPEKNKIYISTDTLKILLYDATEAKWIMAGGSTIANAATATYAKTSGKAAEAVQADYAANATCADNATEATHAVNADSSSYATYSLNSKNAGTAQYAINTSTAEYAMNVPDLAASTVAYTKNSGTADYAKNSGTAAYVTNMGTQVTMTLDSSTGKNILYIVPVKTS